jgi:tetratricopeptide (TPR) repeat protein
VAYGGRAAAFMKKGDYDRALADYNMLVFSYAVELDAADAQADSYGELVGEAIKAYRLRATCHQSIGDLTGAARDLKRADTLEAKLKKSDDSAKPVATAAALPGKITIANEWADPVTLVISGISYTVPPGASKTLATPAGSFPYQMSAGPHRITGTIEAGRTYRVKPPPSPEP